MKLIQITVFAIFLMGPLANAQENKEKQQMIDVLIFAKAAGMCGALQQMATFQETTRMPSGDEFVARFMNVEAARLGYTTEKLLESCEVFINTHNNVMESLGWER